MYYNKITIRTISIKELELFSNILTQVEKGLRKKPNKLWKFEGITPDKLIKRSSPPLTLVTV